MTFENERDYETYGFEYRVYDEQDGFTRVEGYEDGEPVFSLDVNGDAAQRVKETLSRINGWFA